MPLTHFIVIAAVALMMFRSDSNLYSTATDAVPRRPVDPRPRKWPTRAARTRARATSRPAMRRRSSSYRPIWYLWKHCSFLLSLPFYSLVCSRFQSRGHDFGITVFFMKRSKVTSKLEHQHGDDDRGSEGASRKHLLLPPVISQSRRSRSPSPSPTC